MIFKSSGELTDPRLVGYRSLGFGESISLETKTFELTISLSEIPELFLIHADAFIQQCEADDKQQEISDIPELEQLCYPNYSKLVEHHPALAVTLIKDYLYFDLLESLFPYSENLKLVINSIQNIILVHSSLIISGETFPFQPTKQID
ncbi:hypothetical protein PSH79_05395 [Pseudomonas sp. FP2196]|uniref:hypothetical protein n=1 Tax=Pseudomonas sp. FP2196 TaxID=2954086 RepID=UPI0027347C12|nr:hypothetical protein [Pseudomonas sp. FP2196]WLH36727.1 hypothetical protein PSH79_05395 [Pseudomonas sp. FP2196]